MNKQCKCGGVLQKDKESKETFCWMCPECGHSVHQRRRRPDKLNAEKDILVIRKYIKKLLIRNPLTLENRAEWRKFSSLFLKDYLILDEIINRTIVILPLQKKKGKK